MYTISWLQEIGVDFRFVVIVLESFLGELKNHSEYERNEEMYFNILSKKGDIEKGFCFFIFVFFGAVFFNEWLPTIVIVGNLLIAIILGVCYMAIMFKIAGLHREIANEFKKGATAIVVNSVTKSTCIQHINGYYLVHGGGSYRHPLMAINNANRVIGSIIGYAVVRNDIHVEIRAKKQTVRKKN